MKKILPITTIICCTFLLSGCQASVDQNLVADYQARQVQNQDQLLKSIQEIPESNLYYYFGDQTIPLQKKDHQGTMYLIDPQKPEALLSLTRELFIHFKPDTKPETKQQIIQQENLEILEMFAGNPQSILVATTPQSTHADALQSSQYLVKTYPESISYAMPNFHRDY